MHLFFCIGVVVLSSASCSRKSTPPNFTKYKTLGDDYIANSCVYSYDQGNPSLPNQNQRRFQKAYFGQNYNHAHLDAVLKASAYHMYNYISAVGPSVYAYHTPSEACHPFAALPAMPTDLENLWDSETENSGLISPYGRVGLFISKSTAKRHQESKSVIVIRTDSDRWTLLHEFMHFLFHDYRENVDHFDEDQFIGLFNHIKDLEKKYWPIDKFNFESQQQVYDFVSLWIKKIDMSVQHLGLTSLEELSIELQLLKLSRRGELQLITNYNIQNAFRYISIQKSAAQNKVQALRSEVALVLEFLKAKRVDIEWTRAVQRQSEILEELQYRITNSDLE